MIFCNEYSISDLLNEGNKYFKLKKPLYWVKNNHGSGDLKDFAPKVEMILHFQKGRNKIRGKRDSNVLYFSKTQNKYHPTEKPTDLLEYLITKLSDEGQLVLDCFAGSGSTCLAARNTNREYIGIELDSDYFKTMQERLLIL